FGAGWFYGLRSIGLADDHPLANNATESRPEKLSLRRTDRLLTFLTSGIASAAASALLFLMLRRVDVGPTVAAGTSLAFHFASPWQVYGTLYYGHVLGGFLALLSLHLLLASSGSNARATMGFLAGLIAGSAVLAEYTLATFVLSVCLVGMIVGGGKMF